MITASPVPYSRIDKELLQKAFQLMCLSKAIDQLYEEEKEITAKLIFNPARGHEAITNSSCFTNQ